MSKINDGGPAFPRPHSNDEHRGENGCLAQDGMSLRDWFAGKALQGMISAPPSVDWNETRAREYGVIAYQFADAMIKAREEGAA